MPDKRHSRGCGKSCIRCWHNKLNHGSKLKKKMFPKMFMFEDEEQEEYETPTNVYLSNIDEFQDKYIYSTYSIYTRIQIDHNEYDDYKVYNKEQIRKLTMDYNEWLYNEKKINKQVKEKDFIKLLRFDSSFPIKHNYYKNYIMIDSNYLENKNYDL